MTDRPHETAWVIVQEGHEHTEVLAVVRGTKREATVIARTRFGQHQVDSGAPAEPVAVPFFDFARRTT